jgi:hypothetical protein
MRFDRKGGVNTEGYGMNRMNGRVFEERRTLGKE